MSEDRSYLGVVDPAAPRPGSKDIATRLRAAIMTRRLAPGDRLPSQPELAEHYGVARETVRRALDVLRTERLIFSRQGAGVYVRAKTHRPVTLRPHIEAAFERPHVSIDFAGFSGETLRDAATEALDKVRSGDLAPESLTMRLLISDMSQPTALPANAETRHDDPAVRRRADRITHRAIDSLLDQVHELGDLRLVPSVTIEARVHSAASPFKVYLLNYVEAFFGFYPVTERTVAIDGAPTKIYDVLGKDVPLLHYVVTDDDNSHGTQFIESASQWFDSMWNTIARPYQG